MEDLNEEEIKELQEEVEIELDTSKRKKNSAKMSLHKEDAKIKQIKVEIKKLKGKSSVKENQFIVIKKKSKKL